MTELDAQFKALNDEIARLREAIKRFVQIDSFMVHALEHNLTILLGDRKERDEAVDALHQIAREEVGLSSETIKRIVREESCPD